MIKIKLFCFLDCPVGGGRDRRRRPWTVAVGPRNVHR